MLHETDFSFLHQKLRSLSIEVETVSQTQTNKNQFQIEES